MELGSLYYLIHGQKKKFSWSRRLKMMRDICSAKVAARVSSEVWVCGTNWWVMARVSAQLMVGGTGSWKGGRRSWFWPGKWSEMGVFVARVLAKGLMCIHRMKIVHRDLKSANCLVNKNGTVKICDFGLSRIMTDAPLSDSSLAGTPEYMAPELIRNEPYTEKCDIFSFGVIIWELYNLNRPWAGVPSERVVYAVANEGLQLEIPEGPLGRLMADCWAGPLHRPSCEEILTRLVDLDFSLCL
ncbi:mitogen-activated protein kinase kinase kinase [Sarracenia purpurea var. burkii]